MCTKLLIVSFLFYTASPVPLSRAELEDPEQKRHWFYLQTLAMHLGNHLACIVHRQPSKEVWPKYHRMTDELAQEIETYIERYEHKRPPQQSLYSFKLNVWRVPMWAELTAFEKNEVTDVSCAVYLSAP